ncbi:MAG TPA: DUF2752 domain-containing protein [Candidatus Brocadiia bacterium]|nr:DUF2752 domain-containing protein [Candidatus Brocadiia bacterium]
MKIRLVKWSRKSVWIEAVYGAISLCAIAATSLLPDILRLKGPCPLYTFTSYPCPACGTTRAWCAMSRLDIETALRMNPLGALLYVIALAWVMYAIIAVVFRTRLIRVEFTGRIELLAMRIGLPAVIIANWLWIAPAHHALWQEWKRQNAILPGQELTAGETEGSHVHP